MTTPSEEFELAGHGGRLVARRWQAPTDPSYMALLCHGYGEHIGRYEHVAARLAADGAAVYGLDHVGHGRSGGERVLIGDYEPVVDDFRLLADAARAEHPHLPIVLIGHSMGGMIAARYAQRYGDELAAVVLSAPVLGSWSQATNLLELEEIPDVAIDPDTLSRDASVGAAYVADELVWHGPFKRPTLEALARALEVINTGGVVDQPILYLHGTDDALVPREASEAGWKRVAGERSEAKTYAGARHEIFNETNADEVFDDVTEFIGRTLGR